MISSAGLTWTSVVCGAIASLHKGKLRLLRYTVNAIYYYVKPSFDTPLARRTERDADRRSAACSGPGDSPPDHQGAQCGRLRGTPRAAYGGAAVSGTRWRSPGHPR